MSPADGKKWRESQDSPAIERPDSWHAILDAAIEEFAEHGRSGVRIEHVARRAGYNKSLIYRFFKDRDSLFQAALQRQFETRDEMLPAAPDNFVDVLSWWSANNQKNPVFMRMILREALENTGERPVQAEAREAYYQSQIEVIEAQQVKGQVANGLDPKYLFLALLGVSILPTALPQICQLVTGVDTNSKEFEKDWSAFLSDFSRQLGISGNE